MREETVSLLCQMGEYTIFTCTFCKSDHTWPTPSERALKQYYDRPEWFTGGERGGYRDYDEQTAWSLDIYDSVLAEFSTQLSPSVLDVGCGYGSHLALAKSRGWKCFGIELSEHARRIALERLAGEAHIVERVEDMLPHRFDLITILDTIEHLASPYQLLFALFALGAIDEQTTVVFTSPNAGSVTAKSNPAEWAYRHPPSHLTYYSADSFNYLLKVLRFQDVVIKGVSQIEPGTGLECFDGLMVRARGSDFAAFMQERYVPGTWSKVAEYEHVPRYTLASRYVKAQRVLDFGCGTGYGAAMLSRTATSVLGLDIDSDAIFWSRNWHRQGNLSFLQASDFGDGLPSGSFDVATCFEMIEHVDPAGQERTIASIARLLSTRGVLVISTPNPDVTQLYGTNPYHLRELSRIEFDAILRQHFRFVQVIDQSAHAGVIFRPSDDLTVSRASPINSTDFTPIRPLAFVAICSQSTLPALDGELYYDAANDFVDDFVQRQTAANRLKYENYAANESLNDLHRRLAQQSNLGTVVSRLENASESQSTEIHRLNVVVVEKDAAVEQQSAEIRRMNVVVVEKDAAVEQQSAEIRRMNAVVVDKDAAVEQQSAEIRRLYALVLEREAALTQQTQEICRLNVVVVDKDAAVEQQSVEIRRLYAVVLEREASLTQQTQEVRRLNMVVVEKDTAVEQQSVEIRRLYAVVLEREAALTQQTQEVRRLNMVIVEKDAAVEQQSVEIRRLYAVVLEREAALTQQTQEVRRLNVVVVDKDTAVEQQSAEIRRLNVVVVDKDTAVEQQGAEIRRLHAVVLEREAALTQQSQEVRRLNVVVVDKDAALQVQTGENRRLEASVLGLNATLGERAERLAALESQLSERVRILDQLSRELAQLRGHLGDTVASLRRSKQEIRDLTRLSRTWEARHTELSQSQWFRLGNALTSRPVTFSSVKTVFTTALSLCTPTKVKGLLGRFRRRSLDSRNSEVNVTGVDVAGQVDGEPYRIRAPLPVDGRRPRVLHVIANFCTGGSSRLVVDLIEQLGGDYEHRVLTSFIPVPPAYSGLDIHEIRSHDDDRPFIQQLVEYAPDIVHVHYWGDCDEPWYARAINCASRLEFPIVENINTPVKPYVNAAVVRYVFVSDYVRTQFGHEILDGITIHPGSDFTLFSGDLSRSPEDCVGMVYRLERDKLGEDAILPFITAARLRPKAVFLIVGGGSLLEPFKQATRAAGVESQFEFAGYVAYERLPELYRRMSIFVAPVWKESFGQVSPFAMSMGVAVCGYDVGALREITGTPETLAPAGDHELLAEIIAHLLDDPSKRQDIAQRQNNRALQHFSLGAMIEAYRRIYGDVCEPGRTA